MTQQQADDLLIPPYGGKLVDLVVSGAECEALMAEANHYPSLQITDRNLCDLELLAVGGFSPLDRFMSKANYQ
ncbi:MAG: adenylyltransferase, partial [Anaerolineae bacterium]|nr:adenylyltransferase [Anaerolineae bacterium]